MNRALAARIGASLVLILPVLLQKHVQAGDLASHLYNTWLVLLVRRGEPLGLEIVPQYSNVLFDWWLEGLWQLGGAAFAAKAAVSAAVLLFFWGACELVQRISGRPAWPSSPLLAMLAYGWVYHQGFFNYYLSCAFGFWALAEVWRTPFRWPVAAGLLAASAVAHPFGAATAAGIGVIVLASRALPWRMRAWLVFLCCAGLGAASYLIQRMWATEWDWAQILHLVFATSFRPFGEKYNVFLLVIPFLWWVFLLERWLPDWRTLLEEPAAYVVLLIALTLSVAPSALQIPTISRPFWFLEFRLALFLTVFVQGLAARSARTVGLFVPLLVTAMLYFAFLAYDYRQLHAVQEEFIRAARRVPRGSRVVGVLAGSPLGMNPLNHMVATACIGRCFSYANYEPSSTQFRLRALPGSPAVLDSSLDVDDLQAGRYIVRERDVPLYAIFPVSLDPIRLEARSLAVGERVPRQAIRFPPDGF